MEHGSFMLVADSKPDPRAPHNDLPPVEHAPILEDYWRLGERKFREKHAVETKTDERGFVDHVWLLEYIDSLVDEEYLWPHAKDIHHLQWTGEEYEPYHFQDTPDPTVPNTFREIAFHKLLIPCQMHKFLHKVTLPPRPPDYEVMKKRVDAHAIAVSLFQAAERVISIERQHERLELMERHDPRKHGHPYIDKVTRRVIDRDTLVDRYCEFAEKFQHKCKEVATADLDDLIDTHLLTQDPSPIDLLMTLDKRTLFTHMQQAMRPDIRTKTSV
mgnify:CR=1 FL=1